MLQGAHYLAQGVALQVEEDQLGAGGKRMECSRLLETLSRRVKESLAGSPDPSTPVYPSLFSLKSKDCCQAV